MNDIGIRIAEHPFAKPLSETTLRVMSEGARQEIFEPGEVILRPGEPANRIYLIESGKVAIETGAENRLIQTIGAGMVLGWSWLFPPFTWHLQARAIEQTRAIRVNGGHLLAQCETNPKVGYEIMKRVSQVVIQRLQSVLMQNKA